MSTSYNNDGNYSVYVTAYSRGLPDNKSLSSPRVLIAWRVAESYKSENPSIKKSIVCHNSNHPCKAVFASPELRHMISGMLAGIDLPFELDRLIWKPLAHAANSTVRQLHNADDMISQILEVINGMVVAGRKIVDLTVEVEKEHVVPHEEYEAKFKAGKERELAECIADVDTKLRMAMASTENRQMAGMIRRICQEKYTNIQKEMRAYNVSEERVMDIVRSLDPESEAMRQSFDQAAENKPRPASKASIEALEKFISKDGDVMISMCVICKEEMTACKVIRMPCSHEFHEDCIVRWLNGYDHRCPLCKFKLQKRKKNHDENEELNEVS